MVVEEEGPTPGLLGRHALALPAVELPISSLRWSVFLPPRDTYGPLEGGVQAQRRVGSVRWRRPFDTPVEDEGGQTGSPAPLGTALAAVGTMPVRINVPRTGHRLNYHRYWIAADEPVALATSYVRGWLIWPAVVALAVVLVALVQVRRRRVGGLVGVALVGAAMGWLAGPVPPAGALLVGLGLRGWRRGWLPGGAERLWRWVGTQRGRLRWPTGPWTLRRLARLGGRLCVAGIVLVLIASVLQVAAPLLRSLIG
ncbi:MAG: hypothetical protein R3F43_05725 [bacterium]